MTTQFTPRRARRRTPIALVLVLAMAALVFGPAGAARAAGDEAMKSFDVVYDLQQDGSVRVAETIKWQFPAGEQRHGIFRNIVVRMGYNNEEGKYRFFEMSDVSVSSPTGAPDQFQVTEIGAADQIRIGSADEWTSGTQTYVVKYTLRHVLNPIEQNDTVEFHYNVFGANESTPRDRVSVTVNGPAASTDVLCFWGPTNSQQKCQATAGTPTRFGVDNLAAGDGMTVIAQYPAAAFDNPRPDVRSGDAAAGSSSAAAPAVNAAAYAAGIGAPLIAAAVMGMLWWTRGRDERYADLTPGLSPVYSGAGAAGPAGAFGGGGTIAAGRAVPAGGAVPAAGAVPAGGAAAGPDSVTRRGGRPTIAVQFQPPKGVQPGMVGTIIDETANPIDVSATVIDLAVRGYLQIEEVQTGATFKRTDWRIIRLQPPTTDRLLPYESELLSGIFKGGRDEVLLSELKNTFAETLKRIQSLMYREVVQRGWFRQSPQLQRSVWQGFGIVIAVLGGIMLFYGRGFLSAMLGDEFSGGIALGVGLVVAGGIVYLVGGRMAAKTPEGSAVLAQSLGFKEYLLTAEAGQIAFEEASNIFSRYLPYAVVFGVADRWARTFAEVARAAEAANQPLVMPTWYLWSGNAFPDFTGIANGVDSFSTTSTGTFTSTPGSSGSSGFSGGGGFSGSGGGGSSSGSW